MAEAQKSRHLTQKDELAFLRRLAYIVSESLSLDLVLKEAVNILKEISDTDAVLIYLMDFSNENFILKASSSPSSKHLHQVSLKVGEGLTGWVGKMREKVIISTKAYTDKRFKGFEILTEDTYEAFFSLPIIYEGIPVGIINIQNKEPKKFSKKTVSLVEIITNYMSGIIANARMYEETKRKMECFQALVRIGTLTMTSEKFLDDILEMIVEVTAKLLNSKICSIMLVNDKKDSLKIKAVHSLSKDYILKKPVLLNSSLSGDAIKKQKALTIYDVKEDSRYQFAELAKKENLTSLLIVPMLIGNEAIGVLNVYTRDYYFFRKEEIDILQIIANQVAVTIDNRRLIEENIKTKEALETRKLVERAKGLLMKNNNIDEHTAYRLIHKKSMDSCRSMKEIAEAILLTDSFQAD